MGHVPAIGWGTVIESRVAGIDVGSHLHGWYPMASTVDLTATPTEHGFRDDGAHRSAHAPIYRAFTASDRDAMYTGAVDEERHSLLRVLYLTGHLIQSFLAGERFAAVEQSIVMSASSKTAIAYAFAFRRAHAASGGGPALVGVTSHGNADFVRGLGLYDRVITYGEVDATERVPSVVVDMAGVGEVVAAVHAHLGDLILHSMIVGKSHHDAPGAAVAGGPPPELFFAPTEVERQIAVLGAAEHRSQLAGSLAAFIDASRRWLEIEHHRGPAAFQAAWARALSGAVAPSVGLVASMVE
jgi:hypothetical protein